MATAVSTQDESQAVKHADTHQLSKLLQTLPQELHDEIVYRTFTINQPVNIDRDYRQPAVLQVNHVSREIYARQYYQNCAFHSHSRFLLRRWLISLTRPHVACLRNVRFDFMFAQPVAWSRYSVHRGGYPVVSKDMEAREQRCQAQYWVRIIRDELGRSFRPVGFRYLTAQAWTVEDGIWEPGVVYRFGDDPGDV